MRGRPVLVTGGAGFIGSHLVDALVGLRAEVRVIDDLSTGSEENLAHLGDRIELRREDVRDFDACLEMTRGVRIVFHQAALGSVPRSLAEPHRTVDVNVAGTATVFAAAREEGVERIVFASSSSVYGDSEALPKVEGEEGAPVSPYAASKRMDEELAEVFTRCYGTEIVGLRYFNVYGPRQDPEGPYAAVIPRFFAAALGDRPCRVHGDGLQSRDFTFVADAVAANLAAAVAPAEAAGRAYNVAAGRRTTILELAETIADLVGSGRPPVHEPPRSGDVRHSQASPELAARSLGFRAEVSLEEGLRRSLDYYRERFATEGRGVRHEE